MATIRVKADRHIEAPAAEVYRFLADYRTHHPAILPPNFSDFTVEEGGVGSGTVIHFTLKAGGKTQSFRQRISEPDPGRVITETTIGTRNTTTFTVAPEGAGCHVTIQTEFEGDRGLRGLLERIFAPFVLRRIYADELQRLDDYARTHAG